MPTFSAKTLPAPREIAFVLFDRTKLIDVTGPLQVFADACLPGKNGSKGEKAYRTLLVSAEGGDIVTDTGVALATRPMTECLAKPPDTLLISGGNSALAAARSGVLRSFVRKMTGRSRRVGSICLGAFILAASGLLNGRRATTHWMNCGDLQVQYPEISVCENSIFEEDQGIWTSAGVTSGIDMALAMVEQDLGRQEALRLAQTLVLFVRRTGGQRQFSSILKRQVQSAGGEFDTLVSAVLADLSADLSVPQLAAMAHMSERNFARRFTAALGVSPARFVEELRVEAACESLQRGDANLADLPHLYGFGNAERMRRAFQRNKGIAPQHYQARFGGS